MEWWHTLKQMGPEALTIRFGQLVPCFVGTVYWLEVRSCGLYQHMLRRLLASLFFQLALINSWSLTLMPSQVPAFNTWSLKCLRWMSELLPEMHPMVFFVNFPADPRVVGEYRWSGPRSSLSDGRLSEQRVWDVLHFCMLRPAIPQHSSQTATNTISAALLRHSDVSPRSVFFFFFTLFSLSVKSTVLGSACNFTRFPLGPVHSQAIFWTVV